jgi:hypothetical protein
MDEVAPSWPRDGQDLYLRCSRPPTHGDCVIAEIARAERVLGDLSLSKNERAEALNFLVSVALFYGYDIAFNQLSSPAFVDSRNAR